MKIYLFRRTIIICLLFIVISVSIVLGIGSRRGVNPTSKESINQKVDSSTWGYEYINLKNRLNEGEDVNIVVLDTDSYFQDNSKLVDKRNFLKDKNKITTKATHADEVISIINEVAPQAKITLYVIADENGTVIEDALLEALACVDSDNSDIVNMSLKLKSYSNDIFNKLYTLSNKNVSIVAAAGNDSENKLAFPARLPFVFSASAISADGSKWIESNYGKELKFALPGAYIKSMYSDTYNSGTSLSAAFLTGVIAQIKCDKKKLSNEDLLTMLIHMSGNKKHNMLVGYGTPIFRR